MPRDNSPAEVPQARVALPQDDVSTLDGLIAWLETQDPETAYDYCNASTCLLTRYLASRGWHKAPLSACYDAGITRHLSMVYWQGYGPLYQVGWRDPLADAAYESGGQSTYGAALTRAKALRGY